MGKLADKTVDASIQKAPVKQTMDDLLKSQWPKMASVMPKHMSPDRMLQIAISTVNQTPKLAQCDVRSLLSALMKCSILGIEPSNVDGLGRAYIIPYGQQATFILGYKGIIDLARRSGELKSIETHAVYMGDEFDYYFDGSMQIKWRPDLDTDHKADNLLFTFCVAEFINGGRHIEVMSKKEIDAIRKRSKAANNGPWVTDYEAMAKKTVVRRAAPYLPAEIVKQGVSFDETADGFEGILDPVIDIDPVEPESLPEATESPQTDETVPFEPEPRKAVCSGCGSVVELTQDCLPEDIEAMICDCGGSFSERGDMK